MSTDEFSASGQPPAGWYPDPTGQHQQRWWDGQAWTTQTEGDPTSTGPTPGSRRWWPWAIAGAAVVVIGLIASVLVVTRLFSTPGPLTEADADALLMTYDEAPAGFDRFSPSDYTDLDDPDSEWDSPRGRYCSVLSGVSRVMEAPPDISPRSRALPPEISTASFLRGVNFHEPQGSESYDSSVKEKIAVFPNSEAAAQYVAEVTEAVENCPLYEIELSSFTLIEEYENIRIDQLGDTSIQWDSTLTSEGSGSLVDFEYTTDSSFGLVQRGPNVVMTSWWRSEDSRASRSELNESIQSAIDKFLDGV